MRSVVFAGPSIDREGLSRLTDSVIAPPIRRGDLEAFGGCDVFLILDGEFGQSLSVSPKEILRLLDVGKMVIGAASMGALRASELDSCGMIGVGWVYRHFAKASVRRDDDVAMTFSPHDFTPLTVPMVNVEYWLAELRSKELVSRSDALKIVTRARRIFFADRSRNRLMKELQEIVGVRELRTLLDATSEDGEIPDIKRKDSEEAVSFVVDCLQGSEQRDP